MAPDDAGGPPGTKRQLIHVDHRGSSIGSPWWQRTTDVFLLQRLPSRSKVSVRAHQGGAAGHSAAGGMGKGSEVVDLAAPPLGLWEARG